MFCFFLNLEPSLIPGAANLELRKPAIRRDRQSHNPVVAPHFHRVRPTVATELEKISFHSNPKEEQSKECSNYHIIALISHASKVMLKILRETWHAVIHGVAKNRHD